MRVLVGCEFSGIVRESFAAKGHDAWSCDLLPSEIPGKHLQCDLLSILDQNWDLAIFHPPCTHLASSGAAWFKYKKIEQKEALDFVFALAAAPIARIAIENPVGVLSTKWRKPDQIIHPWMFGHYEQKATCLWLKNLPLLRSTKDVWREMILYIPKKLRERLHYLPPSDTRWAERSRTYKGIATAMSEQWT